MRKSVCKRLKSISEGNSKRYKWLKKFWNLIPRNKRHLGYDHLIKLRGEKVESGL